MREQDRSGAILPKVARGFGGKCGNVGTFKVALGVDPRKSGTRLTGTYDVTCFRKQGHIGKHRTNSTHEWTK